MGNPIIMHELRQEVDKRYVGFNPNSSSIKPVHVAGGLFRTILGKEWAAKGIQCLSYVCDAKGKIPKGHAPVDIKAFLSEHGAADFDEITDVQLDALRNALQKLVGADHGVFPGDMRSYTAGSYGFVTRHSIHEGAGEFIGGLVKAYCPKLGTHIEKLLLGVNNPASLLFAPVMDTKEDGATTSSSVPHEGVEVFEKPEKKAALLNFLNDLKKAGECLTAHLEKHGNALLQLRMTNLFCVYFIVRYLSVLEAVYCDGEARPFLLDFSEGRTSVSQTSELCYMQLHRSISRFYAWVFAQELGRQGFDPEILSKSETPIYDARKKPSKDSVEGLKQLWQLAKDDAKKAKNEKAAMLVFGAAIYDMIAMEAESHPVNYLRMLGTKAGLLYPPNTPGRRFVVSDDMAEVILRSCVKPGETLASGELSTRLRDHLGVIIGGGEKNIQQLKAVGSIIYADADALDENFGAFTEWMDHMGFAEQLPDGILQVNLGN
jgi:hypothetical protein